MSGDADCCRGTQPAPRDLSPLLSSRTCRGKVGSARLGSWRKQSQPPCLPAGGGCGLFLWLGLKTALISPLVGGQEVSEGARGTGGPNPLAQIHRPSCHRWGRKQHANKFSEPGSEVKSCCLGRERTAHGILGLQVSRSRQDPGCRGHNIRGERGYSPLRGLSAGFWKVK